MELLPTYLCLIAGAFLIGNTRFVRFGRRLLGPIAYCVIAYRAFIHFRGNESETQTFLKLMTDAINIGLNKCRSKPLAALMGDIIGLFIVAAAVSLLQTVAFLKFSMVKKQFFDDAYGIVRHIPHVKAYLVKEQVKIEEHFEKDLKEKSRAIGTKYSADEASPNSYSKLPAKVL